MERHEYKTLFETEDSYWWFRALREALVSACGRLGIGPNSLVLDAGCGTGATAEALEQRLGARLVGVDMSMDAAGYSKSRGLKRLSLGSVNALPFRDGSFDAAVSVDVLECDSVDERLALSELRRVVRDGGHLLLVVPAYRWLMSPEHHRAVHASRRYTRDGLSGLLETQRFRNVRMTHLFASLFPPIAAFRLWKRAGAGNNGGNGHPRSELRPVPAWLNETLFRAVDWERRLHGRLPFPFGSSILLTASKDSR